MIRNSKGVLVPYEAVVFPIFTFLNIGGFRCLGTGFFINEYGGFITAKHVFMDPDGQHVPRFYGVQTLLNGERVIRQLEYIDCHPHADIAHGMLGVCINQDTGEETRAPIAETLSIMLDVLDVGDKVNTYGYPIQEITDSHMDTVKIEFQGVASEGEVLQHCREGSLRTRNDCYETTLVTNAGHSGGPVMLNNNVVGVNSSSVMGGSPSYFTPLHYMLDLRARDGNGTLLTFREVFKRQENQI